jgi:hypothetical protein
MENAGGCGDEPETANISRDRRAPTKLLRFGRGKGRRLERQWRNEVGD